MVHTQYQQPYSEVDGLATLLRYPVQSAGGCKVCANKLATHTIHSVSANEAVLLW